MIDSNRKIPSGSVLVYLVVLILIFGILGAAMVSMFTTSTTSTATPNCARRAFYMWESGVRYAFSELRHSKFSAGVFNTLNSTTYNVKDAGSFTINTFSPWFTSNDGSLELDVPAGKIPDGLKSVFDKNIAKGLWIVNFEYTDPTIDGATSQIADYTRIDDTTLQLTVSDPFNVAKGERVCLGVKPSHTQGDGSNPPLQEGDDLYVEQVAKDFFPRFNGTININRVDYSYDRLVDEPDRVKLENLSAKPTRFQNTLPAFPLTVKKKTDSPYTGDFIVLSPRNYMVIPTGRSCSDSVSFGNHYRYRTGLYDYALEIPPPDIHKLTITENETNQNFISVDTVADRLNIGGGVTSTGSAEFGAGWYNANKSIGGRNDFCLSGKCLFGLGVRVFFILKFANGLQGDGLTFTLMNAEGREVLPPNNLLNNLHSVGGDYELGELMGYAGDSRTADGGFLDPADPRGIQPPKLAIEFDTRTNFDTLFESEPEPKDYCIESLNNLKTDTRNDPLSDNRDAVQYVFWGDNALNVPCRSADPSAGVDTYDDNRHGTTQAPINDKGIGITSSAVLDSSVEVDSPNDWLNGGTFRGPWAIRIEIEREENLDAGGNFDSSLYTIRTWIRQCETDEGSFDCTDQSIIGYRNPFESTRIKYDYSPVGALPLLQQVEFTEDDHNAFERFFFGFTGAAGSEALDAEISRFQLSFIRLGDSAVTSDPNWTP